MKYTLSLRRLAVDDIDAGVVFYDSEQAGLGQRFRDEVANLLRKIESNPRQYPLTGVRQLRKAVMAVFPFCIYYQIEKQKIQIVAVHDSRRDPSVWMGRA